MRECLFFSLSGGMTRHQVPAQGPDTWEIAGKQFERRFTTDGDIIYLEVPDDERVTGKDAHCGDPPKGKAR